MCTALYVCTANTETTSVRAPHTLAHAYKHMGTHTGASRSEVLG